MLRRFVLSCASLFSFCGCAATIDDVYLPSTADGRLQGIGWEVGRSEARLVMRNGRSIPIHGIRLGPVSTSWEGPTPGNEHTVATSEIHSLVFRERKRPTLAGLAIGALIGLAGGALIALFSDPVDGSQVSSVGPVVSGLQGGIALGFPGSVIGAFVGRPGPGIPKGLPRQIS